MDFMGVILVISAVVVIGAAAATQLSTVRVRRRRKLIELFTSAISDHRVAPLPVRRPRITVTSSRFRHMSTPANVAVLADYRKAHAGRLCHPSVAGFSRSPGPQPG